MLVCEKILIVRSSMHLDEKRFGQHFRQSVKTIHDWENGFVIPTRSELRSISRYTRISIDDYLNKDKLFKLVNNKLVVEDDPIGSKETIEPKQETVLEDYPREDNARYEERD